MKHQMEKRANIFYFYFKLELCLLITLFLSNDSINLLIILGRVINNFNIDSANCWYNFIIYNFTFYFYFISLYLLWRQISHNFWFNFSHTFCNNNRYIINYFNTNFYTIKNNNHPLLIPFFNNNNYKDNYYNSYCFSCKS